MIKSFIDQLGRKVEFEFPPKRIISLVPSQTELLHYLGLDKEVVGITKFCVHPHEWFQHKTRIGGTKKLDFQKIKKLNPDLIIGNKEENEEKQIKGLMESFPVWMSDVRKLEDALEMILRIGELVNRKEKAVELKNEIEKRFSLLPTPNSELRSAYFIWRNPMMVAGKDTFVNDVLKRCGLVNVFEFKQSRYPEITAEDLKQANPDIILLSSEPFPFKEKHISEFQAICASAKVVLADGEMFSWYGSRLLLAADYLKELIRKI